VFKEKYSNWKNIQLPVS